MGISAFAYGCYCNDDKGKQIKTSLSISREEIKMKTYVITGANSGLGFETAKRIAAKGHRVIPVCMDRGKSGLIGEVKNE